MDASSVTIGSEDIEIHKNKAEKIVQTVSIRKRRNLTSLTDEQTIKKIKNDFDNIVPEEENDENNIQQHVKRRKETIKFPKLYRLLNDNENVTEGLSAKSPNARKDVATHVATGSRRDYHSQYISTCASLEKAEYFRNLKLQSGYSWGMKHIAEIDVDGLPEKVEIIDLTTKPLRKKYEISDIATNKIFHKFAERHQEVLLVGTVPASCLKLIEFAGDSDVDTNGSDSEDLFDISNSSLINLESF